MRRRVVWFAILFSLTTWSEARAAQDKVLTPSSSKKLELPQSTVDQTTDVQDILESIEGIKLLLQRETNPDRQLTLQVRLAQSYLEAGRAFLVSEKAQVDLSTANLRKARESALEIEKRNRNLSDARRVEVHTIAGLASLYMADDMVARLHFTRVLELNPQVKNATWYSLFIADRLFTEAKFVEAMSWYAKAKTSSSRAQREYASYKTSWCLINLSRTEEAIQILEKIYGESDRLIGEQDLVKDVVFVIGLSKTPQEGERYLKKITKNEFQLAVLWGLEKTLRARKDAAFHPLVVEMIRTREMSPSKKLLLDVYELRMRRQIGAFDKTFAAYKNLSSRLRDAQLPADDPSTGIFQSELEAELLNVISEVQPKIKKNPQAGEAPLLIGASFTYLNRFERGAQVNQVLDALLDACIARKDLECLKAARDWSTQSLAADAPARERSDLAVIALTSDSVSDESRAQLTTFLKQRPQSPNWTSVAKTLANLLEKKEDWNALQEVQESIFRREPTDEHLRSIHATWFKTKGYERIVEDSRVKGRLETSQDLKNIRSDALLALAEQAKKEGQTKRYEERIREFLAMQTDPKRIAAAKSDLLSQKASRDDWDSLLSELNSLSPEQRARPEYVDLTKEGWNFLIDSGRYDEATKLVDQHSPFAELRAFSQALQVASVDSQTLGVPGPLREVQLQAAAVLQPEKLVRLRGKVASLSKVEQSTFEFAVRTVEQLKKGSSAPQAPDRWKALLGEAKRKLKKKDIEGTISSVARARTYLNKQGPKIEPAARLVVISEAAALEASVAEFLKSFPIPVDTPPEQVASVKAELETAAAEYTAQSQEYLKAAEALKQADAAREKLTAPTELKIWPWPKTAPKLQQARLEALVLSKDAMRILLYTGLLQARTQLGEADRFSYLAGAALMGRATEPVLNWLRGEIEGRKREDLLDAWRKSL